MEAGNPSAQYMTEGSLLAIRIDATLVNKVPDTVRHEWLPRGERKKLTHEPHKGYMPNNLGDNDITDYAGNVHG